jgi:hypothetical protein
MMDMTEDKQVNEPADSLLKKAYPLGLIWLAMRMSTSIYAAIASGVRPLLEIERTIGLWPPEPLSMWLERVLIAPWLRFDAEWYEQIVIHGYQPNDGTAQFHPLYPWIATLMARLGAQPMVSLLLISSLSALLLILVFELLGQMDLNQHDARFSTLSFLLFPSAFILFTPYTEALFLLLAVSSFFFMRKRRWWLAGIAAGLATLTRQQGLFLLLPMAVEICDQEGSDIRKWLREWRAWLPLGLIPISYLIWLIYRGWILGDLEIGTASVHDLVYSLLISPSANKVVEIQAFLWPWQAIGIALHQMITRPDLDLGTNLFFGIYFLVLLGLAWKHLRASYRLYSAVIVLLSFSYYTGPVHPYMGLLRHLYLAFPIFIGFAVTIKSPWQRLLVTGINQAGFLFLLWLYVVHAWIP